MNVDDMEIDTDVMFLQCDHCEQGSLILPAYRSVLRNGLILLSGQDDGYIGATCQNPDCRKTILKKETKKRIQQIRDKLFEEGEYGPGYVIPRIRYHSFPFSYGHDEHGMPSYVKAYWKTLHEGTPKNLDGCEVSDPFIDNSEQMSGSYCSYFLGDMAIGPAIYIFWLPEESIVEAVNFENENGIRVFPRYVLYDRVLEAVDTFCYEHFLELEFNRRIRLPEGFNAHLDPSETQREARRSYDFLKLLTTFPQRVEEIFRKKTNSQDSKPDDPDYASMAEEVASFFNEGGYGKDYLDKNAIPFIHKYIWKRRFNSEPVLPI